MISNTTFHSLAAVSRFILTIFMVIGFSAVTMAQTPTNMLNPPDSMCNVQYPINPSFAYNETRFLGVGLVTEFTYQILSPVAGPVVSENVGAGALSSGATSYTFATPITSGLTINALNTIRFCVAGNCANYTVFINPSTEGGTITGTKNSMCVGDDAGTLTLSGNVGAIYDWEMSSDNGVTWAPVLGAGTRNITSTYSPGVLTTTTYFRAISRSGFLNSPMPNGRTTVGTCDPEYSTTFILTVHPYPAAPVVGSNSPICSGNTINLSAASPASGATYNWTTTATTPFTSGLQNPSIAGSATTMSGDYNCTVTANGCTSTPATVAVTVNQTPAAPTLGSNTPVCTGNDVNLTATSALGGTFNWVGPNSFNSTETNPTIVAATIAATGTYSATNTVAGCTGPAGTTSVVMNPTPSAPIASNDAPVCEGDPLNVSSTTVAGATYTWSGPAGAGVLPATQNLSFPSSTTGHTGTYTVFATLSGCSSLTTSTDVVVNTLPAAPILSSNSPVCTGNTLNLTANAVAGSTYIWNGPGFSSTIQNPAITNVTPAAAGSYNCDVTNILTGCTSAKSNVTVVINPTPAAPSAANNGPICEGTTLTLTGGTIPGATYSWTGPGGFSSAVQSPTVTTSATATNDGNYSITATVSGCTSAASTTVAIVKDMPDAPVLSSNSAICVGQTLNLFAATVPGAIYSWNGPSGYTSATQNPVRPAATAAMSGTYTCTVTVDGCTSPLASIDVLVSPIPATPTVASNTPVCAGGTLNLTTPAVTNATYIWTGPNAFASSSQNPSIANVTTAATGSYSVTITVNGCSSAAGSGAVTITPTPATPTPGSNSPICSGSTLNLTTAAVPGATYSWTTTSPTGFASALQNPTIPSATTSSSGTYSVTTTVAGCTSLPGTVNVVVNAIPNAPVLSNNGPVCMGGTINLFAGTVPAATYAWTGPGGFVPTSTQNPTIAGATAANAGTYSCSVTVNGCTSATSTTSVSVIATPATPVVTSNSPICEGATINLSAPGVMGATYSWTGPNGFTSNTRNPSIPLATTSESGSYSVITTIGSCSSAAGSGTVTVNPSPATPTASSNTPVCAGNTITLTASTVPGATYSWTGPNGFTSAVQNPTIAGSTTADGGIYAVTAIISGCNSAPASTVVAVNTVPAAPTVPLVVGPVCEGTTINLVVNPPIVIGGTYNWSGPGGYTSGLQNPSIPNASASDAGMYSVVVTQNGCTSPSSTTTVLISPSPAAPTLTSDSPACVGETVTLSASIVAGATSYDWSGPGFSTSTLLPSTSFTTTAASETGIYSVTVIVAGCPSPAATTQVNVYAIPSAPVVTSNSPVCEGTVLDLFAEQIQGASYAWSAPTGFTSAAQNPGINNVQLSDAATYSVVATVNGCASPASSIAVTVNDTPGVPTAGSNSPLCAGDDLNLTASSSTPGVSYSWTGPGSPTFSSGSQNPTITGVSSANAGSYFVTATLGSCTSPSGIAPVTISTAPTSLTATYDNTAGLLCEGTTLQLHASPDVVGAVYNWSGPAGFFSSEQNPVIGNVQASQAGSYVVTATVGGGCSGAPASVNVVLTPAPSAPVSAGSNSPVCEGSALSLTASAVPAVTYDWTGPNFFTSTAQNPTFAASMAASGTYVVRTFDGTCYSSPTSVPVAINAAPPAPVATTNGPVCQGSTLDLMASTIVGATYQWSGPSGYSSSAQNPTIPAATPAIDGTYCVIATVGTCVSPSACTNVTVATPPAPAVISANGPLCEGTTLQLTASTVTGAVYNWSGPNGFTSIEQNPVIPAITLAGEGTYSLTTTLSGVCPGSTTTVFADVIPAPASPASATSNSPLCTAAAINLTSSTVPGMTYSWTGPNGFTSSVQNPTIANATINHSGTYSVRSNDGTCLSAQSADVVVLVNPTPDAPFADNDSPACAGSNVQLTASSIAGASYTWVGPGGYNASVQNPVLSGVNTGQSGMYSVTATVNGCVGPAGTTNVIVSAAPTAGSVNGSATVCSGSNGGTLTLSGYAGTILYWVVSTDGGATWVNVANTSMTQTYSNLTQTTIYAAAIQQGTCPEVVSGSATVTVIPQAVGGMIANDYPNPELCSGDNNGTLTLTGYAGNILQWEVTTDGGLTWETIANTTDTLSYTNLIKNTTYRALVQGCTSTEYSAVEVLVVTFDACNDDIVIATMVTPNNDQHNDTWLIEDLASYPAMEVTILNRYGTQVFHTDHYQNEWDATFNGDPLPDGTYYYVIKMSGSDKIYKGHINILK